MPQSWPQQFQPLLSTKPPSGGKSSPGCREPEPGQPAPTRHRAGGPEAARWVRKKAGAQGAERANTIGVPLWPTPQGCQLQGWDPLSHTYPSPTRPCPPGYPPRWRAVFSLGEGTRQQAQGWWQQLTK